MTLDEILKEMKNADTVLILSHESPDGDAIGSSLGMCLALKKYGKRCCRCGYERISSKFLILTRSRRYKS